MKINKIQNLAMLLAASAALTGCQNSFDDPELNVPVATLEANTSIAELKKIVWDMDTLQMTEANGMAGKIIKGRVVSSDATGNIYQSLTIQDETAAVPVTIRRASLFNEYHLGQEVVVNTEGLWLGKYNGLIQLGWLGEPYNGTPQLTFMDFEMFAGHAQLNGLPDTEVEYIGMNDPRPEGKMYCIVADIDALPTGGEDMYNLQNQLVEFRNVSFDGGGEEIYAPYQESVNRYIQAEGGQLKLTVRNSGYSTFYNSILPEGVGTVRGILSWYGDGSSSTTGVIGGWQLLLRSLDDVMFDSKGSKEDPYTIEEASAQVNQGRSGWVKGFIVGSVKGGRTLETADDVIFGAEAEMDNNLVIAPEADCTDIAKCMTVNLPQGSALRQYGNLADNPAVYKKAIIVSGDLVTFLGWNGVSGTGSEDSFVIGDTNLGGGDEPGNNPGNNPGGNQGVLGSKENPFNVAQVKAATADATDVWVEGYVVGYMDGNTWDANAVFGNTPGTHNNYNNGSMIIVSDAPVGSCNSSNSMPVGVGASLRSQLGIKQNPDIYGKRVLLKGNIMMNLGIRAMKNISEYEIL